MQHKRPWPHNKATDIWHVGIAHAPIAQFLDAVNATQISITWLPLPRPFSFIADPFARRDDNGDLTIFVEALDYRIKRGEIHYYQFDAKNNFLETGRALTAKHHLSYPYILQHGGEIYMLPECSRSGKLTLYRAMRYPDQWEPVADLLDLPAIDASPIRHHGQWWMFFALPGPNNRALSELHLACADDLLGPWKLHPQNPVHTGITNSRMGGTPFVHEGAIYLPVQDCSNTYGGAIRMLRVEQLSREHFAAQEVTPPLPMLHPDFADGMHTLSACGDVTLIDVKRTLYSPLRHAIDMQRRARRLVGMNA